MLLPSLIAFIAIGRPQAGAGQALIDAMSAKMKATQSVTVSMKMTYDSTPGTSMDLKLMRGGYLRGSFMGMDIIQTPSGGCVLMTASKQYQKAPTASASGSAPMPGFEALIPASKPLRAVGGPEPAKIGDSAAVKIQIEDPAKGSNDKAFIFLDPSTHLPVAAEYDTSGHKMVFSYSNLKLDAGLTEKDFDWSPPAGWTEFKQPTEPNYEANLLKLGSKAPAFFLNSPKGGKVSLSKAMTGRKATLINFWFYG